MSMETTNNTEKERMEEMEPAEETEAAAADSEPEEDINASAEPEPEEEPCEEEKQPDPEEEAMTVKYMRLMADFQNFKRRTEKEKGDIYAFANEKLVTDLLAVLDNFERALEHESDDSGFAEGMQLIFKQLMDVLTKAGLSEIPALGETFDPNFHNAVMAEDTDEYESGKVSGVMQKGYMLNNKVIRPSMVKVAN